MKDLADWILSPTVFHQINQMGCLELDLDFHQLPTHQLETKSDGDCQGCIGPSTRLMPTSMCWWLQCGGCRAGTSAPGDAGEATSPDPQRRDLLTDTHQDSLPEVVPQLAVWFIPGSATKTARFWREL